MNKKEADGESRSKALTALHGEGQVSPTSLWMPLFRNQDAVCLSSCDGSNHITPKHVSRSSPLVSGNVILCGNRAVVDMISSMRSCWSRGVGLSYSGLMGVLRGRERVLGRHAFRGKVVKGCDRGKR